MPDAFSPGPAGQFSAGEHMAECLEVKTLALPVQQAVIQSQLKHSRLAQKKSWMRWLVWWCARMMCVLWAVSCVGIGLHMSMRNDSLVASNVPMSWTDWVGGWALDAVNRWHSGWRDVLPIELGSLLKFNRVTSVNESATQSLGSPILSLTAESEIDLRWSFELRGRQVNDPLKHSVSSDLHESLQTLSNQQSPKPFEVKPVLKLDFRWNHKESQP